MEKAPKEAAALAKRAEKAGAAGIMVGSSIIMKDQFNETVKAIKKACGLPVILFPGASSQLSPLVDSVFFLSLVSGRNPDLLIGEHVKAAPIIYKNKIHAIPVAYLLIEGGKTTSVEFMSNTRPLPADKPDIVVAHCLAAQYLGMQCFYLEAGSGAHRPVPNEVIKDVRQHSELPIIVGGGIRTPELAKQKIKAGADYVVVGTAIEQDDTLLEKIGKAIKKA